MTLTRGTLDNLRRTLRGVLEIQTGQEIEWIELEVRPDETLFTGELKNGVPFAGSHTNEGIDIEVMDDDRG